MIDAVIGIDVGTTSTKVLVASLDGTVLGEVRVPIDWFAGAGRGTVQRSWQALVDGIATALERTRSRAVGIGIASVAESGVLVAASGEDLTSPIAWHDPRGRSELEVALRDVPPVEFNGITGLPMTSLCSAAKIAHFRANGVPTHGATWLTLGEYLSFRLSGKRIAEASLASRTGLYRQDNGQAFVEVVAAVGGDTNLLPPVLRAGDPFGTASGSDLPDVVKGAVVTVAGHDHLVAAFGTGVGQAGSVFNSAGTGDVILTVTEPIDNDVRASLVAEGATSGRFIDGVNNAVVAGIRGGLLLETLLSMLGSSDLTARQALDRVAVASPRTFDRAEESRVRVSGADKDLDRVIVDLGVSDATQDEIWWAGLREISRQSSRLWALSSALIPPTTVRCAGGWTRLECIRLLKRRVFGEVEFLPELEAGATGAAALGWGAAHGVGFEGARDQIANFHPPVH